MHAYLIEIMALRVLQKQYYDINTGLIVSRQFKSLKQYNYKIMSKIFVIIYILCSISNVSTASSHKYILQNYHKAIDIVLLGRALNQMNMFETMSSLVNNMKLSISQTWSQDNSGQQYPQSSDKLHTLIPQTQMQEILSILPKGIQNLVQLKLGWIASMIGNKLTAFASNFPTTSTVIGVSASAASAYAWKNQYGLSYEYSNIDYQLRNKLQSANSITQIEMYRSPLEDIMYFQHYQIIFKMDNMFWGLISLAKEGLETKISLSKQELVDRRKDNERKYHKNINVSPKQIIEFLKENQNKIYHTLEWNCQSFSIKLWRKLTK